MLLVTTCQKGKWTRGQNCANLFLELCATFGGDLSFFCGISWESFFLFLVFFIFFSEKLPKLFLTKSSCGKMGFVQNWTFFRVYKWPVSIFITYCTLHSEILYFQMLFPWGLKILLWHMLHSLVWSNTVNILTENIKKIIIINPPKNLDHVQTWSSLPILGVVVLLLWQSWWWHGSPCGGRGCGGRVVIRSEYGDTFVGLSKNPCTAGADSVSVS